MRPTPITAIRISAAPSSSAPERSISGACPLASQPGWNVPRRGSRLGAASRRVKAGIAAQPSGPGGAMETMRLTVAQAIVRFLITQRTVIDEREVPLFPGVFAIFGHGNVTALGDALEAAGDALPTWRGHVRSEERRVGKECRSRWS